MRTQLEQSYRQVSPQASPAARFWTRHGTIAGLLACGALSSLLYVFTDVLASLRYGGYSYADQWVSELVATGSPVRSLTVALFTPYNVLFAAFALGVVRAAAPKRFALITGLMLAASASAGELTMLFFPMDQRGAEETLRGGLHGPLTAVMSLFTVLAIGLGSTLLGQRFRWYSVLTVLVLLVFGALTSVYIPKLSAGEPTPWMGAIERINIYAQMLWVSVLAILLLRQQAFQK